MKKQKISFLPIRLKRIAFARIDEWLNKKFLHRDISELMVYLAVLSYGLIFSYFTVVKFNSFSTYAWDLGIFDQSLWTTLHSGKLFFSTVELFIVPSGVFFGTHFSPILFLVLPFYALDSSPQTLLVFQSFILAVAAVPLYFFAKNILNNKVTAVVFSFVYLLYSPLQGVNWFDFHVQAFLPLFFFCSFYFLIKENWSTYFLFIFLSLAVAENIPIMVVFIGLYCFWRFREQFIATIRTHKIVDKRIAIPVLTIIFAIVWLLFANWIRQTYFPFDPAYTQLYKAVANWSKLGVPDDPIKLPLYLIMNPLGAFAALTYDFWLKLLYLFLLFAPLLFLSLRSSISAISLAWFVPALFSNYTPYYTIGGHFPAYPIAFIFLGAVAALQKDAVSRRLPTLVSWTKRLLLISLLFTLIMSPLSPVMTVMQNHFPYFADYHLPTMNKHDKLLRMVTELVPNNVSILTQNNIFSHFSSQLNAYVYPLASMVENLNGTDAFDNYVEGLFKKSEYVMIDYETDSYTANLVLYTFGYFTPNINQTCPNVNLLQIRKVNDFRLCAYGDNIYLFMKNYSGNVLFLNT